MSQTASGRKRICYFDLIGLFSCFCVSLVHFNAAVCGYDGGFIHIENSFLTNFLLNGRVYVGSLGVSLFFMLSGARLMYTWRGTKKFYIRRFQNIFPMFWLAYAVAFMADLLIYKGVGTDNPLKLIFTALGLDGYLMSRGLLTTGFYKLGEWFLGAILALYLIFPLLHWGVEKKPVLTVVLALVLYVLRVKQDQEITFYLRIPEMLFGMLFIKYDGEKHAKKLFCASAVLLPIAYVLSVKDVIAPLTLCIALAMVIFCLFAVIPGASIKHKRVEQLLASGSNLTYPIFLVHHWLIARMMTGFSIEYMPRRTVLSLFVTYIVLTLILSHLLNLYSGKIQRWLAGWRKKEVA